MADETPTPEQEAQELSEAVVVIRNFNKKPRPERVQVLKHLLDKQIGTDDTAVLKTIPGLTPQVTEMMTDPLLDILASVVDRFWSGGE
ncbi:MAG: hypothetical protein GTN64_00230 [Candidatus Latescibacteria bacterium]|nr:hypothetical protein [Candidatus Latescibacterota bacterium]NIO77046.1 hypothetical protein [Candidatus Latescibacterota bacterium]